MDVTDLAGLVDEYNYLLARISKYLKNNQYVYLRAFESWQDAYNQAAARLNAGKVISVPIYKLSPVDFSPSGKSIKQECVVKFVRSIHHQVDRLEEKIRALNKAAEEKRSRTSPLAGFFHRGADGKPVEPLPADHRVFVAMPPGAADALLFWQGVQPALEMHGLSFFRSDRVEVDDAALSELCQELHACRLAIFNLSDRAPNVMLALGLAYGIGKPVIVLQRQDETPLGAQVNNGYLRYASAADIKKTLGSMLAQLLKV